MNMQRKTMVAPSILSADFATMGQAVEDITKCGADLIHCDVMDGVFVPNITFGPKMVRDIRKHTTLPLDVHLMICRPEKYVDAFIDAGADYVTFHMEAANDPIALLQHIKDRGICGGAVISPDTEVAVLQDIITLADMVLLMSVYPGFGGQTFIEKSLGRMQALRDMRNKTKSNAMLEIDGGITIGNIQAVLDAGAEVIVAGSTVFQAKDMRQAIQALRG